MELTGEHRIPASRKAVWDALHDPEILKNCIKGCEHLEFVSDNAIKAKVTAKVGPVKATFDADAEIVDPVAPERYTLKGEGKGGVAGFAKGAADVHLTEDGPHTVLTYHATANIGGKLAQLGSRLVDSTAKRYAADFFASLSEQLGGGATEDRPAAAVVEAASGDTVEGRVEPTAALAEEDMATAQTPVAAPNALESAERDLEVAAGKGRFGGPFVWGILAFAVVILVLLALQ